MSFFKQLRHLQLKALDFHLKIPNKRRSFGKIDSSFFTKYFVQQRILKTALIINEKYAHE